MKRLMMAVVAVCAASAAFGATQDEGRLPAGYEEAEYVQGDGTAYINLGLKLTEKDVIECVAMATEPLGIIFGERNTATSSDGVLCGFPLESENNFNFFYTSRKSTFSGKAQFVGQKLVYHCEAACRAIYGMDGTLIAANTDTPSPATFTAPIDCYLFGANGPTWTTVNFAGRIYSFVVISGGVPRMELIPCVHEGEFGFYDTVSEGFFGNASSSGQFSGWFPGEVNLQGDFKRKIIREGGEPATILDLRVIDRDDNELPPSTYTVVYTDADKTGFATVSATVNSGDLAGATTSRIFPVVALPRICQPVEYVQGDGTAFIDLDYVLTEKDVIECVAHATEAKGIIFGGRTSTTVGGVLCGFPSADEDEFNFFYPGDKFSCEGKDQFVDRTIRYSASATLLGAYPVCKHQHRTSAFEIPAGCYLFGGAGLVWTTDKFAGRIYSFSITRNGDAAMDLVPCRCLGEFGFYDVASKSFLGNVAGGSGSVRDGAFTAPGKFAALQGDFSRKVIAPGRSARIPDLKVLDDDGNELPRASYVVTYFDANKTGTAVCLVEVVSGELAGICESKPFEVAVLPDEYRPVEYVQGDGTAYIDLGLELTEKDVIECVAHATEAKGIIFGERKTTTSSDGVLCGFPPESENNFNFFYTSRKSAFPGKAQFVGQKLVYLCEAARRAIYGMDGTLIAANTDTPSPATFTAPIDCYLFGANGTTWTTDKFAGRIYSFSVVREDALLFDFVPCKRKGEAGFYDTASGTFFGNSAESGAFVAGPVLKRDSGLIISVR